MCTVGVISKGAAIIHGQLHLALLAICSLNLMNESCDHQ